MKIQEKNVKSVITKSKLPDADYVINPYIGCQHACIYCYADFMKKFTGHLHEAWGDFVDVKINAHETIEQSAIKKDKKILFGSVTDPYQPIEAKYRITRKCLEKLVEYQPCLEILTKSHLIVDDINLLKKFKNLRVGISLGILDETISRKLEPYASSPKMRLDTLQKLHTAGIRTYLFISPIFPEITNFKEIISAAKDYANEFLFENLNIRANNKERVFDFIKKNRPELTQLYSKILIDKSYWNKLELEILEHCEKSQISCKIYFHHQS